MKKYFLLIFLACFSLLSAQTAHKIGWGFHFGLTHSLWQFPKTDYLKTNTLYAVYGDTLRNVTGKNKPGIQIGFSMAYSLTEKWKIRLMPCVDLAQADYQLTFNHRIEQRHYETAYLSLPIQILWRIKQAEKSLYFFTGINPKYSVQSNKSIFDSQYGLQLKRGDISLDFGIGYGKIGKTFPINPELRFSVGLNNLLKDDYSLGYVPTSAFKYHSIALICHLY